MTFESWLEEQARTTSTENLGEFSHAIRERCADASERQAFTRWIVEQSRAWVHDRRPALAAILEAAVILNIPESVPLIVEVIEQGPTVNPLAFKIAGQRVRLMKIDDVSRRRCMDALRSVLDEWAGNAEFDRAVSIIAPSVAAHAFPEDAAWIARSIHYGRPPLVFGLACGLLDAPRDPTSVDMLYTAIMARLATESKAQTYDEARLRPCLVWCLGGVTSAAKIPDTVRWLRDAFDHGKSTESAGVIHALRAIVERDAAVAYGALTAAFRDRSEELARVLTLMHKFQPRRDEKKR